MNARQPDAAADGRTSAPIVATRLEPPPLPPSYRPRARIAALLSTGAHESCALTLVSAPPGYGKTVAVRGWLAQQARPFAWLSLDSADDDPVHLVRSLIAALGRVRPGLGGRTAMLLGASGLPAAEAVVATLLDEVAASDGPFVFVLDDFHLLASEAARDLAARFAAHLPPFVQLVLVTRQDPHLPLARLRAHGRLVELRADQLRHTVPEATDLLAALGVRLAEASVERLVDGTEGWAAGLQLAALTLRGRDNADALVADFGATHRYVIDYLADEVLARLPDDLRSFVERTSVAERLCPGLADALTGRSDGTRTLREIEERNLFLVPLGPDGACYRYHHLFAHYLRSRLDDGERHELELRAAQWSAGRGLTAEATGYALASGCWPAATPFVAAGTRDAIERGEPATALAWTSALPEDVLSASSELLADRAWAGYLSGQMAAFSGAASQLARLDDAGVLAPSAAGRARGIRAWLAVLDGRPRDGERLARLALESLDRDPFFRGFVLLALSDACWDLGRADENAAAVAEALRLVRTRPTSLATYFTAYVYAISSNEQGRRAEAERVCLELLAEELPAGRVSPAAGPIRVALGMLAYEANDLERAGVELEAGFAACHSLGLDSILGGESRRARAMTRLSNAGPEAAAAVADEALRSARRFLPVSRTPAAEAVDALVAVRTGDHRRALRWAGRTLADPARAGTTPPNVRLYRDLTLARVLLATGSVAEAEKIAVEAEAFAVWAGTLLGRVQALVIAAAAAEQGGRRAVARERLAQAVELAAPGGYVRRFVEDGAPLAHLLSTVRGGAETFVDAVMAALAAEEVRAAPGRSPAGTAWRAADGGLIELLTQRELDVLRLLARGASNAAIGAELGVSPGTAKWHVANVLGKLGAATRTEAAGRARDLGLV